MSSPALYAWKSSARSTGPKKIWLVTYWIDGESFSLWHHSHLYQQAHKDIPKDLKLVPGETEVRHFEHICS
jgi:heme oxygenase (mycobilin-producing)